MAQQQRVALARALAVPNPSAAARRTVRRVDALTRERLQEDLRQVSAASGRTVHLRVTHSVDEAVFLGSRVVVLTQRPGRRRARRADRPAPAGVDAEELRRAPEFTAYRAEVRSTV
ncbi:hypothetical protein GCM10020218_049380 [Dactylosporangium vinaceum]